MACYYFDEPNIFLLAKVMSLTVLHFLCHGQNGAEKKYHIVTVIASALVNTMNSGYTSFAVSSHYR